MLHLERETTSPPRLVVVDGARPDAARLPLARRRHVAPALLVVAATLFAVLVDLVDGVPAWSHYAAIASTAVLAVHALLGAR
jgi:hypothetical protein